MSVAEVRAITGVWYDYSRPNAFLQYTLTFTTFQGLLLNAGLVLLIRLTGSAVWSMAALYLHQARASTKEIDGLDYLINVLLRNPPGPELTIWNLFQLYWTTRKTSPRARKRTSTVAWIPLLISICFSVAGLLVTYAATNGSISVRLRPEAPGFINVDVRTLFEAFDFAAKNAQDAREAAAIVDSGDTRFKPVINTVPCPFGGQDRCLLASHEAQEYDSGWINSNKDLGITTPISSQVDFRMKTTCAVVRTEDLIEVESDSSVVADEQLLLAYIGRTSGSNFTYVYATRDAASALTYNIATYYYLDGSDKGSTFFPITQFNVTHADVTAHFIPANSIRYRAPSLDPMYLADGARTTNQSITPGTISYLPNQNFSTVICTEGFAYRNPVNNDTTSFLGYSQVRNASLVIGFNEKQLATLFRIWFASWSARNVNTVVGQGVNALQANKLLSGFYSAAPAANQSQVEFSRWFQTGLVNLQRRIEDYPTNRWYSPERSSLSLSTSSAYTGDTANELKDQESLQRVTITAGYINFCFPAVIIVIIACPLLIVLSFALPYIVKSLPNRRSARPANDGTDGRRRRPARAKGANRFKYEAWIADYLFNLAAASVGMEAWEAGDTNAPFRDDNSVETPRILPPKEENGSISRPLQGKSLQNVSSSEDSSTHGQSILVHRGS